LGKIICFFFSPCPSCTRSWLKTAVGYSAPPIPIPNLNRPSKFRAQNYRRRPRSSRPPRRTRSSARWSRSTFVIGSTPKETCTRSEIGDQLDFWECTSNTTNISTTRIYLPKLYFGIGWKIVSNIRFLKLLVCNLFPFKYLLINFYIIFN